MTLCVRGAAISARTWCRIGRSAPRRGHPDHLLSCSHSRPKVIRFDAKFEFRSWHENPNAFHPATSPGGLRMRALSMTVVLLAVLSLAGCSKEVEVKGEKGDVGA